jgi:hypothetical protein
MCMIRHITHVFYILIGNHGPNLVRQNKFLHFLPLLHATNILIFRRHFLPRLHARCMLHHNSCFSPPLNASSLLGTSPSCRFTLLVDPSSSPSPPFSHTLLKTPTRKRTTARTCGLRCPVHMSPADLTSCDVYRCAHQPWTYTDVAKAGADGQQSGRKSPQYLCHLASKAWVCDVRVG